jgi:hypothetical protein
MLNDFVTRHGSFLGLHMSRWPPDMEVPYEAMVQPTEISSFSLVIELESGGGGVGRLKILALYKLCYVMLHRALYLVGFCEHHLNDLASLGRCSRDRSERNRGRSV